jgi:LemA protein
MKWIWISIVIVVVLSIVLINNGLVSSANDVRNKWADVQSAYQRRLDLVNQNLPVVTAGAAQELAVFKTLRDQAAALAGSFKNDEFGQPVIPTGAEAEKVSQQIQAFDQALKGLLVYVADNPDIVSAQLFSDFMVQIEGSENRINVARRDYNFAVASYRNRVQMFPSSIIATIFGFDSNTFPFFTATEGAQNAPKITFPTPAIP